MMPPEKDTKPLIRTYPFYLNQLKEQLENYKKGTKSEDKFDQSLYDAALRKIETVALVHSKSKLSDSNIVKINHKLPFCSFDIYDFRKLKIGYIFLDEKEIKVVQDETAFSKRMN